MPVRISIIVPTYNRLPALRALVESVCSQGVPGEQTELVLADDGSGPEMRQYVEEVRTRFQNTRSCEGPNAGPGVARNRGVASARGDILVFTDSDCIAQPDWLHRLIEPLRRGTADLAYGPVVSSVPHMEPFVHSFILPDTCTTMNFAITRAAFDRLGGFRAELSHAAEDHDFFARARATGVRTQFVKDATILHPPRMKKLNVPLFGGDRARVRQIYQSLLAYYRTSPVASVQCRRTNRELCARAALKLTIIAAPALASYTIAPLGVTGCVAYTLTKWWRINRTLAAAGEPWSIPFREAAKYAALFPVLELLLLCERWCFGLAPLRPVSADRR